MILHIYYTDLLIVYNTKNNSVLIYSEGNYAVISAT